MLGIVETKTRQREQRFLMCERQSVGQTIARRVQEARTRKRWSQRDLAARLTAAGRPMNAGQVNKIEAGARGGDATRAENLSVSDLLVLAAVLGVAPVHLIVPLDGDQGPDASLPPGDPGHPSSTATRLTESITVHPPAMRAWIRGQWPLAIRGPWNDDISDSDAMRFYFTEAPLGEIDERLSSRRSWDTASPQRQVIRDTEARANRRLGDEELAARANRKGVGPDEIRRIREIDGAALYGGAEEEDR